MAGKKKLTKLKIFYKYKEIAKIESEVNKFLEQNNCEFINFTQDGNFLYLFYKEKVMDDRHYCQKNDAIDGIRSDLRELKTDVKDDINEIKQTLRELNENQKQSLKEFKENQKEKIAKIEARISNNSDKINSLENWKWKIIGGIIVLSFFFGSDIKNLL